jgi:hypothetical protein
MVAIDRRAHAPSHPTKAIKKATAATANADLIVGLHVRFEFILTSLLRDIKSII